MKVQTNAADETLVALYAQGNNEQYVTERSTGKQ